MKYAWVLVLFAALMGCTNGTPTASTQPTGSVSITQPVGGETFIMGQSVVIAWTCDACTGIPAGDYVNVFAFDGATGYLIATNASFTDTKVWVVGTTLQNVSLLPGFYVIVLQDAAGILYVQSRTFQLSYPTR